MPDSRSIARHEALGGFAGWAALAAASILLTACSDGAPPPDEIGIGIPRLADSGSGKPYPPGAARVLSLGSAQSVGEEDPFAAATACHAALAAFSVALEKTPFIGGEAERAAVRQAEARFLRQAKQQGEQMGLAPGDVDLKIEERRTRALDNPASELPRATACVRSLIAN